jgi:undecaprenyl-diphosphatase
MTAVEINVPDQAVTVRSPTDALRLLVALAVAVVTTIIALLFPDLLGDLADDLDMLLEGSGEATAQFVALIASAAVLAAPLVLLAYFLGRREYKRTGILILAAFVAAVATVAVGRLLLGAARTDGAAAGTVAAYYPYVAAMTAAITAAAPWMPRRWQRVAWSALVALVVVRLVVGTGFPAELTLAMSIGVAAGAGSLFALGSPNRRPTGPQIVATLQRSGIPVARLDAADVDARGSTPFLAEAADGTHLFVKVLSTDERSADLLFRLYRKLRLKNVGDEPAFSSLRRAVEHEALLSYSATAAGVQTPALISVGTVGDERYAMLLAYRAIDGRSLESYDDVPDAVIGAVWEQIRVLHDHGIAHRDLRLANILLDGSGRPWMIDFGFSELAASRLLLDNDIAEFVTSSATIVGPERAVRSAVEVIGPDGVAGAAGRIQAAALSGATRTAIKQRGDGLDRRIRFEIGHVTGLPLPPLDAISRFDVPIRTREGP